MDIALKRVLRKRLGRSKKEQGQGKKKKFELKG